MIQYLACPDEEVATAVLYQLNDDDEAPDGDGDREIWRLFGKEPTQELRVGVVPVAPGGPIKLEHSRRYWVDVFTDEGVIGSFDFGVSELSPDSALVDGRNLDKRSFERNAHSTC